MSDNVESSSKSNNAVFEYVGKYPLHTIPHGNAGTPGGEYVKTVPTEITSTVANLTQYNEPRQIHTDLVLDDSMKARRDLRQVQNMKYADKKATRETTNTDEGYVRLAVNTTQTTYRHVFL